MELTDYFRVLRHRWRAAVATLMAVVAVTATATALATPRYSSSTRMFFAVQAGDSVAELAQGSSFTANQMQSYAEVARSPLVLDPVAQRLGIDPDPAELAALLTVTVSADTTILSITATHEDSETARDLANAVAEEVTTAVATLSPERADGTEPVRATMLSPAQAATEPSSPDLPRNLALGVVLGLLLGVGHALLREALDTKVRDEDDVGAVTDSPVLTSIGVEDGAARDRVFVRTAPYGAPAEAIRRLRTNLQFVNPDDRPSSITVTSSVPEEGKSVTALNLAVAFADTGARVLLVDADLRRPSVAEYLGLEGAAGLTTVLIGRANLEDVVQPWRDSSLDVLTSGQVPPNPSELLGSRAMRALLEQAGAAYDTVVIDTPPLLPVTDAAVLGRLTGGAVVVAGADRISRGELGDALEALAAVDVPLLGVVLNKVQSGRAGTRSASYSYEPQQPEPDRPRRREHHRPRRAARSTDTV